MVGLMSSLMTLPMITHANLDPRSLANDHRIKTVSYDQNDVVTLVGNHLVDTEIQFDQNEQILFYSVGDSLAWTVEFEKNAPFLLFIKPKLLESDTNMTVVTNLRIYHFHLMTNPNAGPISPDVTYAVNFDYPDEDQARITQQLNSLQQNFIGGNLSTPQHWNFNYAFCGAKDIAPIQAVDNGTFTVFKFPKTSVIPAIFSVDAYRNESLVNFRVQGDYVFIQGVNRQYTLRNGKDVTTVYNNSFPIK